MSLTTALLVAGVLSSLLYGVMMLAFRYDGYSVTSQTVSELSAWSVSTRSLLGRARGGVHRARDRIRDGRVVVGTKHTLAADTRMHQREVLAVGGTTLADTAHLALAGTTVLLMFSAMSER